MNYKKLLVDSGVKLLHSGLTVSTWGNISARDPEANLVYLTPSAMDYDKITEEDIVVTDLTGRIVEGKRKPTIETPFHLGIYVNRSDVNAIIHTHPIYSSVFGLIGEDIPPCIDEAAQIMGDVIPVAPYGLPGSQELARNCVETLGKGYACLLSNHGAVCVASDMKGAFKVAEVLEMTAQIYYMARCIGKPRLLKKDDIAFMCDFAYNKYGQGK